MNRKISETELVRMILLIADTQQWLDELCHTAMGLLCAPGIRLMKGKQYRLTVQSLAHILERHWQGIQRYPGKGKFTTSIAAMVEAIKMAESLPVDEIKGSNKFRRMMDCGQVIGTDSSGNPSTMITVITDEQGGIITAFPGVNDC